MTIQTIKDIDGTFHLVGTYGLAQVYLGRNQEYEPELESPVDPKELVKVADWSKGKRAENLCRQIKAAGWHFEMRYDAPHGFRYGIAIYPSARFNEPLSRRVALAAFDGITDLHQWALDSGIAVAELNQ